MGKRRWEKQLEMVYEAFMKLRDYCAHESYKGWDPYDGLNSRIFQSTPLKYWDIARLILIQALKRSPINLRTILLVPKQYNAKALGLFINGYCNILRLAQEGDERFGKEEDLKEVIDKLCTLLIKEISPGFSGACWGYNFDWQARRLFLFPAHTPTIVATAFCAEALFNASEVTGENRYKDVAFTSGQFILNDLNRTYFDDGFLFSYSPIKGNDTVFNAALLGAKILSYCYHYSGDEHYRNTAKEVVTAVCNRQQADGSWVYGLLPIQTWVDSFHTGYNLTALEKYKQLCKDENFNNSIEKGFNFYIKNFFLNDGTPKYFNNKTWPIDIHCPGQLWVTVSSLNRWKDSSKICEKVAKWTIKNMQAPEGYFYYQMKPLVSSKISYMRWSNAFMFNALSYYLLESTKT